MYTSGIIEIASVLEEDSRNKYGQHLLIVDRLTQYLS